ncbi:MAG: hypothetical protein WCK59_02535 [Candidatus Falkowbacteria bacterium]
MPILTVYGISKQMEHQLDRFADLLIKAVISIEELNLRASDVSCFFPASKISTPGDQIIIFVDGLFEKPERTPEVRAKLAAVIVSITADHFSDGFYRKVELIECFIRPFNPENGFATLKG